MQYSPETKASLDASIDDEHEHDYEYDAPLCLLLCRSVPSVLGAKLLLTPRANAAIDLVCASS